jgi:hypothetical protein
MYYTTDWEAAAQSVAILADLDPELAATGHGEPLQGGSMRTDLHDLARDFRPRAVPLHGRYVNRPVKTDETGVVDIPPDVPHNLRTLLLGAGARVLAAPHFARRARLSAAHHPDRRI